MKNINIIIAALLTVCAVSSCGCTAEETSPSPSPYLSNTQAPLTATPLVTNNPTSKPNSTMNDTADNVGDDLKDAADSAGNAVKSGVDAVGDAVTGTVDAVTGQ